MLDRYADAASSALGEVAATQGQAVEEAARLVAAIPLTNLEQAKATAPRHSSGARLHELADVVIDNRCPAGDAALELASGTRVGPLTTVVGAAVVAGLMARYADRAGEGAP
jgi:uncharacterized phosphosugar-binding protein